MIKHPGPIATVEIARDREDFGNGRYARNLIERARMAQAERLLTAEAGEEITEAELRTITAADVELPDVAAVPRRTIGFGA